MLDLWVAYCPCFETLASLAPQHEVVVFQRVRPHPEEVTKWPSRRMGCNTDLRFQVLAGQSLLYRRPARAGVRQEALRIGGEGIPAFLAAEQIKPLF